MKHGEVLFEIDPQPYQLAVDAAEAQLEIAYQSNSQDRAAVAAARAQVTQRTAELRNAQSTEQRAMELTEQKLISKQSAETTATEARNRGRRGAARRRPISSRPPAYSARRARRMPRCAPRPPSWRRPTGPGAYAHHRARRRAASRISNCDRAAWCRPACRSSPSSATTNSGWTRTSRRPSCAACSPGKRRRSWSDMYRDHEFKGVVQSLSGGAGQAFSLLPAQNATGNWVKVTQRVPVRVQLPGSRCQTTRCASAPRPRCACAAPD